MIVRAGNRGHDDREVRRPGDCRKPLCCAYVRCSEHAHRSTAPRLCGYPFHRVIAIVDLVGERIEFALRVPPTAHVLDDDRIACFRCSTYVQLADRDSRILAIVGCARQQGWIAPRLGRPIDVGPQCYAVPHPDRDRIVDHYLLLGHCLVLHSC